METSDETGAFGRKEQIGLVVGALGFGLILLVTELGWVHFGVEGQAAQPKVGRMLAITWLMATWWMTEALPIAVTSLLPVVLFPILKIMPSGAVAREYMNEIIMLFLGGFLLALAIQKWGLHRRISLHIVSRLGGQPAHLILGFMIASAGLSMWISNTATTMMLLPIALSVAQFYEREDKQQGRRLGLLLMLSVAYASSIGGIATLVGTPTNLTLVRIFKINFPQAPELTFVEWLKIGLPISLVLLPLFWWVMTRILFRDAVKSGDPKAQREVQAMLNEQLVALGPIQRAEKWVLVIFALTACLWIFRVDIKLGEHIRVPGWSQALGLTYTKKRVRYLPIKPRMTKDAQARTSQETQYKKIIVTRTSPLLGDGAVAILMALLLFLLPAGAQAPGERLMDWKMSKQIPWGMLLLFGGGFALAAGIKYSGMSAWMGEWFRWKGFAAWGSLGIIFAICFLITFITEFTSNTATTEITLAIMAPVAIVFGGTGVHPYLLMIPVTIAASCAFMMPVATPPNAIAYSSGYIPMSTMVRTGVILNLLSTIAITLMLYLLFQWMGLEPMTRPAWLR